MSVSKVNDYAVGDTNFTSFMETLDATRRGLAQITISEYDTDSAPSVKVGSVFDNQGAFYQVTSADETPTGYSGISVSTTFFLYFDVSALAFIYSSTAPTWSDLYQGWYNGEDRAFFSMYKDSGGTLYEDKRLLINKSLEQIESLFASGIVSGAYTPSSSVGGSWVVSTTAFLIPAGVYAIQWGGGVAVAVDIYVSGSWRSIYDASANDYDVGGFIFSDGVKTRIRTFSGSGTAYYLKF